MIWNLRWRRISWFWCTPLFPNMWRAPSELVSELIRGWVWLLGWGDSGFWSAVLTVSVGFRLHLQWFHSPWSAFTSSSEAYVDVMRCRRRVVQVFTGTWKKRHTNDKKWEWPRCFQQCEFWVDFSFKVCVQSWQRREKPRFRAWWGGEDHGSHEASTGRRHLTVSSGGSQGSRTPAERS